MAEGTMGRSEKAFTGDETSRENIQKGSPTQKKGDSIQEDGFHKLKFSLSLEALDYIINAALFIEPRIVLEANIGHVSTMKEF